ncbi:MAG: hypothetical protein QM727_06975 [Niabella sp.]
MRFTQIYTRLAFLFLVVFISAGAVRAQDVAKLVDDYTNRLPPERAHIHLDKHQYAPGETIWFKAYLMTEIVPAIASKTFYIDWIDDKGNLLKHTISPLANAMTNGQFEIPDDYKGRLINVRAYTRWMLNFDTAFLYNKIIPILNRDSLSALQKIVIKPMLEFFPEGGNLIAGIPNKVAFKSTDQWGRPLSIKGVVTGDDGKVVDSLRTLHDGMGFLMITPRKGTSYKAKWHEGKNAEQTTAFPSPLADGLTIQVVVEPDKRGFTLKGTAGFAATSDSVHIVGTMFQHVVFNLNRAMQANETISATIPTKDLPYGVLTITVFDKKWQPVAERITYINNQDAYIFPTEMDVQHWGLSYRARDEVKIKIPENVEASLSISVTDLALGADSSQNILSDLMLSGEIKGKVNNPAYYFAQNTPERQQKLDLVMLTNGWRRFNWKEALAGNQPKISYPRDKDYISLSGKVIGVLPSMIGPKSTVMMMTKSKDKQDIYVAPIQKDGTFTEPAAVLFDTTHVYYQIQDKTMEAASVQFMADRLRVPPYGKPKTTLFPDTTGMAHHLQLAEELNALLSRNKYKELEAVTVTSKTKSPVQVLDEKYTSGMFSGGHGTQLDVLHDPFAASAMDIFSYLQGKVAGLQISGSGANASLSWRGGAPALYLDEVPTDVSMLSGINVNDVAYIKTMPPPFLGGFNGANGAVAIYTRRGGDAPREPSKGLSGSKIEGYTLIKEFYSPKYLTTAVPPGADRDLRTTIYWNPAVHIAPGQKEVILTFYNNDVTDAFRVVIEGMSSDGRLTHLETTME